MTEQQPWFIEERAIAFASLVLTSQDDVVVRAHAAADMAVDLLVEILENGKSRLRFFGVQVVASLDLPDTQNANMRVLSHLQRDRFEATLPLCVFVIGARKPEGVYRWIVEPVVEDGRALLRHNTELNWRPLDKAGAADMIRQVKAWYAALNGGSTPKSHRGARTASG
jgi:hypothetical protein